MKKQFLLALILLVTLITAEAQKPDMAHILIHYKFTWVRDTTSRAHPYTENMVLYVGKRASVYRSYDGVVYRAQFKKAYAKLAARSVDGRVGTDRLDVGSDAEYYEFPNERKLITKDKLLVINYQFEGPLPIINWKISSDTATFDGLHCQQATCHFKGRDYTVWFCPELPVHTGPWKLNGLPGVIVDARDAKNEVVFKFNGVEKAVPAKKKKGPAVDEKDEPPIIRDLDDDMNIIASPPRAVKTTQKEFNKLNKVMQKDPDAFAQAVYESQQFGLPGGDAASMDNIKVRPGHRLNGPVINNPVELPEKK
jgi:GLPGLI family protein